MLKAITDVVIKKCFCGNRTWVTRTTCKHVTVANMTVRQSVPLRCRDVNIK
jgi:hypothetical protein